MVAALCKKQELARSAQFFLDLAATVEPAPTIVGHEHAVFYAYPREDLVSGRGGVHILGLDVD